jgi:hypothetical protein
LGVEGYSGDDDDWVVDTSEEAVRRRREAHKASLSNAVKDMIANELDYSKLILLKLLVYSALIANSTTACRGAFEFIQRLYQ